MRQTPLYEAHLADGARIVQPPFVRHGKACEGIL
jgi:hypothetical protein